MYEFLCAVARCVVMLRENELTFVLLTDDGPL